MTVFLPELLVTCAGLGSLSYIPFGGTPNLKMCQIMISIKMEIVLKNASTGYKYLV